MPDSLILNKKEKKPGRDPSDCHKKKKRKQRSPAKVYYNASEMPLIKYYYALKYQSLSERHFTVQSSGGKIISSLI